MKSFPDFVSYLVRLLKTKLIHNPSRDVLQSMSLSKLKILVPIVTPAQPLKPRVNFLGWTPGKTRLRKNRFPI
ncbi:MAG: hypothetical protein V7K55_04350 [Nostoc sp.]|uniref:hypothetical protein n=1 Tax=Nostoc sp. TaxID=1180 RepID=UPI002FFA9C5F